MMEGGVEQEAAFGRQNEYRQNQQSYSLVSIQTQEDR